MMAGARHSLSAVLRISVLAAAMVMASTSAVGAQTTSESQPEESRPDPRVYWPEQEQAVRGRDTSDISQAVNDDVRAEPLDIDSPQISAEPRGRVATQITSSDAGRGDIGQLSAADLEGQLDQLSDAERKILFEAIEGTDICEQDEIPEAIRKLCAERIETRSTDFAAPEPAQLSAEERLLGERLDETGRPDLAQVIDRFSRGTARPDDLDNQSIASIALSSRPTPTGQPDDNGDENAGDLPLETQAIINAIVQQLSNPGG